MRPARVTLAIATLAMVLAACERERWSGSGLGPPPQAPTAQPRAVGISGYVFSASDSTAVRGVLLEAYEITAAGAQDIRLGSVRSAANGAYSLRFSARCDRMYGLRVAFPHAVVRCSRCPVWPLPAEGCGGGGWGVDLWVEG